MATGLRRVRRAGQWRPPALRAGGAGRSRDPTGRGHRGERRRRRRRARRHPRGAQGGEAGRPGQQGKPGDGGRPRGRGGLRRRRRDRAGGLGAQRGAPVRRRTGFRDGPPDSHLFRRPLPRVAGGAGAARHGTGGAPTPDLADGAEDHRGQRHTGQQGAGGDRGALSLPAPVRPARGGGAPAEHHPRVRGVLRRQRHRAAGLPQHGAADPVRADPSRPTPGHGRPPAGSRRRGAAHLRAGAAGRLPGPRRRHGGGARGRHRACGVQRRQRGGGRRVPGGSDSFRSDQRGHRAGARGAHARARGRRGGGGRRRPLGADARQRAREDTVLVTIIALIIVLGVLIFVHEAGHFIAAKWAGIYVHRFSLGLGSPIPWLTFKRGETEYSISWLPLGGYVKMASREEDATSSALEGGANQAAVPPDRMFEAKPVWQRMVVILAGVAMNAVFAWLLFTFLAVKNGRQIDPVTTVGRVVDELLPPEAAEFKRIQPGTRIVSVNGHPVATWDDITQGIATTPDSQVRLQLADGSVVTAG